MDQDKIPQNVIISKIGYIGCITLNRPKALNALTLDMIRDIRFALDKWEHDDDIKAIYICGYGDRAFCAGGDIKHFYKIGMDYRRGHIDFDVAMVFFKEEYALNEVIFYYPKPLISHMHGITMGGGYGIAGNAKYRIVTAGTIFAMPEVKIGFFPDIGSMYHLARVPDNLGLFLAMSGSSIASGDMLDLGLAEYSLELDQKESLLKNLNQAFDDQGDLHTIVKDTLERACLQNTGSNVYSADTWQKISKIFNQDDCANIIDALVREGISTDLTQQISKNSPFSMLFAYSYFNYCKNKSFSDVISSDVDVCACFAKEREFYEGIRAVVIDKDKTPKWLYKDITNVRMGHVAEYMSNIDGA